MELPFVIPRNFEVHLLTTNTVPIEVKISIAKQANNSNKRFQKKLIRQFASSHNLDPQPGRQKMSLSLIGLTTILLDALRMIVFKLANEFV